MLYTLGLYCKCALMHKQLQTFNYKSGTVNSNTVNSKFHLIRSYYEIFFYHFSNISCLKCTVNLNFHLIRSKTLPTNDFELTVPNLYLHFRDMIFAKYSFYCSALLSVPNLNVLVLCIYV